MALSARSAELTRVCCPKVRAVPRARESLELFALPSEYLNALSYFPVCALVDARPAAAGAPPRLWHQDLSDSLDASLVATQHFALTSFVVLSYFRLAYGATDDQHEFLVFILRAVQMCSDLWPISIISGRIHFSFFGGGGGGVRSPLSGI